MALVHFAGMSLSAESLGAFEALAAALAADLCLRGIFSLWPIAYALVEDRINRIRAGLLLRRLPGAEIAYMDTAPFYATVGF